MQFLMMDYEFRLDIIPVTRSIILAKRVGLLQIELFFWGDPDFLWQAYTNFIRSIILKGRM